ncbi:hypothetical protein FOL47_006929 [Perkinsus chesapeaki]|uniref:Uncharacterized protein n=1 Tax=Perkinsus chesapeaki TaxID=330153 RepID=A0A7J6LNG1_PERCH|nr:hypothetical protein FOL47_006929 [Perkinsus chesapeaki]
MSVFLEGALLSIPSPNNNRQDTADSSRLVENFLTALNQSTPELVTPLINAICANKSKETRTELLKYVRQQSRPVLAAPNATDHKEIDKRAEKLALICRRSRPVFLTWIIEALPVTSLRMTVRRLVECCSSRLADKMVNSLHGSVTWILIEELILKFADEERFDSLVSLLEKHEVKICGLLEDLKPIPSTTVIISLIENGTQRMVQAAAACTMAASVVGKSNSYWYWESPSRQNAISFTTDLLRQLSTVNETPLTSFLIDIANSEHGSCFLRQVKSSGLVPDGVLVAVAEWILLRTSVTQSSVAFALDFLKELANKEGAPYLKNIVEKLPTRRLPEAAVSWCTATTDAGLFVILSCKMRSVLRVNADASLKERYTDAIAVLAMRGWNCDELSPLVSREAALAQLSKLSDSLSVASMQGGSPIRDLSGPIYAELAVSRGEPGNLELPAGKPFMVNVPPVVSCVSKQDAERTLERLKQLYGSSHYLWLAKRCLAASLVARDCPPLFGPVKRTTVTVQGATFEICVREDVPWQGVAGELLGECRAMTPGWWSTVLYGLRYYSSEQRELVKLWATVVFGGNCLISSLENRVSLAIRSKKSRMAEHAATALHIIYADFINPHASRDSVWIGERRRFVTLLVQDVAKAVPAKVLGKLLDTALLLGPSCGNLRCLANMIISNPKTSHEARYPCLGDAKHRRSRQVIVERLLIWADDLVEQSAKQLDECGFVSGHASIAVEKSVRFSSMRPSVLAIFFEPPRPERLAAVLGLITGLCKNILTLFKNLPMHRHPLKSSITSLLKDLQTRVAAVARSTLGALQTSNAIDEVRETVVFALSAMAYDCSHRHSLVQQRQRVAKRSTTHDSTTGLEPAPKR